ncbi:DUF1573 domain-containing protein [Sediminibacterium soli]|uniref:DUF1573 domain-containing protein n=1 Tax=Sediminibacterium soli TaxID=2698829 RepID=UPI00137986FC|nr:DUF1573 domain-containing protein [Sediminibacterium soli]NCI45645.1 DUF1573 domain-containing protein [Sediminibacterium soli]
MKKILFTLIAVIGMAAATQAQSAPGTGAVSSVMKFSTEKHDFGVIPQNIPASYTFSFTNTGKEPLVIKSAVGSCGCTVPEYTQEAIPAGGKGSIKVTYNAAALGPINKTVTVTTNSATTPVIVLSIGGEVKTETKPASGASAGSAAPVKN